MYIVLAAELAIKFGGIVEVPPLQSMMLFRGTPEPVSAVSF